MEPPSRSRIWLTEGENHADRPHWKVTTGSLAPLVLVPTTTPMTIAATATAPDAPTTAQIRRRRAGRAGPLALIGEVSGFSSDVAEVCGGPSGDAGEASTICVPRADAGVASRGGLTPSTRHGRACPGRRSSRRCARGWAVALDLRVGVR